MPTHSFHAFIAGLVAQTIEDLHLADSELMLDAQCGGNRRLSLFRGRKRSTAERICQADIAIKHNGGITVIIEIEEAGSFHPGRLFGKATATDSANYLIASDRGAVPVPLRDILFIQVVNTASYRDVRKSWNNTKASNLALASTSDPGAAISCWLELKQISNLESHAHACGKFWRPRCAPWSSWESSAEALRTARVPRKRIPCVPGSSSVHFHANDYPAPKESHPSPFTRARTALALPLRGLD